jgi:N-acetylmuramoyl-L-alanine amidase
MRRRLVLLGALGLLCVVNAPVPARAAGGAVAEKFTTLDESLRLADRLRAAGIEVGLTRSDDRYVDLSQRAAASRGADLLLSVHNNANASRAMVGTEAYYQLGNRFGGELTGQIVRSVSARAGTVRRGAFTRRGDNGDYYAVLRESPAMAIIVEGAFLSNAGEARRLATVDFRQRIADGIADAVIARLVANPLSQGAGPPPPKATLAGAVLPTPSGVTAAPAGRHAVELKWHTVVGATAYDVWRDGHFVTRLTTTHFGDSGVPAGLHRYQLRAVLEAADVVIQESNVAATEVLVPVRVVIDPGHGGRDSGAIGRW